MTPTEIILAVISSSVLSSILTATINWKLHTSNYKKEYYKKILEKRLGAYESVQLTISKLAFQMQLENYICHSIFFNVQSYDSFVIDLAMSVEKGFWLDNSTQSKLTELNVFLINNISNKVDHSKEDHNQLYQKLGNTYLEEIRRFRVEIEASINSELSKLHDVDRFFKMKGNFVIRTFPIYHD